MTPDPTIIDTAGWRTHTHDSGQGRPVLLLHGSGPGASAWTNWSLVIPALEGDFRVIAPDLVGFGLTERPAGFANGRDAWAAQAIALLDALRLERVDVVGNSYGGAVALALAIRFPQRVGRLVLMGSVGTSFAITPGLEAVWGYTPSPDAMRRILSLFMHDQDRVSDALVDARYQASILPGLQDAFAAMFPAPRQACLDAAAWPEAAIRAIPHETLIIHGREDRVVPLESSLALARWIPRSTLHVFGQCGHLPHVEHSGPFLSLIKDFLSGLPRLGSHALGA